MNIVDLYDAFLIDLDGAVYVGQEVVPGAAAAVAELRRRGKPIVFVTNDSRGAREDYVAKLGGMGIPVTTADILTAGSATATFIREQHDVGGHTTFAIGPAAFKRELVNAGHTLVEGDEGRTADFVAVAYHNGFNYRELLIACQAVRRGAPLYGSNRDPVFPMPDGPWPATGSVLAAVEVAGGKKAIVVGKPEQPMIDVARHMLPAGVRVAIVGDTLSSDILGGLRAGIGTVLVLSGNTKEADLASSAVKPDHVLTSIARLC